MRNNQRAGAGNKKLQLHALRFASIPILGGLFDIGRYDMFHGGGSKKWMDSLFMKRNFRRPIVIAIIEFQIMLIGCAKPDLTPPKYYVPDFVDIKLTGLSIDSASISIRFIFKNWSDSVLYVRERMMPNRFILEKIAHGSADSIERGGEGVRRMVFCSKHGPACENFPTDSDGKEKFDFFKISKHDSIPVEVIIQPKKWAGDYSKLSFKVSYFKSWEDALNGFALVNWFWINLQDDTTRVNGKLHLDVD
jgi:hypothetical protein